MLRLSEVRATGALSRNLENCSADSEQWQHNPVPRFRQALIDSGTASSIDLDAVNAAVEAEIVAAIEFANADTEPIPGTTMDSIYT